MFSNHTKKYLLEAGWHPGRKMNIDNIRNAILSNNYKFFHSVENFLYEFGDLNLKFPLRNGIESNLHFDVIQSINEVDPIWVQKDYYKILGNKDLCIIGQAHSDHLTLMMDEAGNVYGGFDDYFIFIASSGERAIEAICSNQMFSQVK